MIPSLKLPYCFFILLKIFTMSSIRTTSLNPSALSLLPEDTGSSADACFSPNSSYVFRLLASPDKDSSHVTGHHYVDMVLSSPSAKSLQDYFLITSPASSENMELCSPDINPFSMENFENNLSPDLSSSVAHTLRFSDHATSFPIRSLPKDEFRYVLPFLSLTDIFNFWCCMKLVSHRETDEETQKKYSLKRDILSEYKQIPDFIERYSVNVHNPFIRFFQQPLIHANLPFNAASSLTPFDHLKNAALLCDRFSMSLSLDLSHLSSSDFSNFLPFLKKNIRSNTIQNKRALSSIFYTHSTFTYSSLQHLSELLNYAPPGDHVDLSFSRFEHGTNPLMPLFSHFPLASFLPPLTFNKVSLSGLSLTDSEAATLSTLAVETLVLRNNNFTSVGLKMIIAASTCLKSVDFSSNASIKEPFGDPINIPTVTKLTLNNILGITDSFVMQIFRSCSDHTLSIGCNVIPDPTKITLQTTIDDTVDLPNHCFISYGV